MRCKFLRFFAASFSITLVFFGSSFAQKDDALSAAAGDRYTISAKAGHVNYVEGSVAVARKVGKSGLLLKGDKLAIGDRVSTDANGKAEILLNPGSFLRLGELSSFEFETTDLDSLKLRIDSGSAVLEVYATDEFTVSVRTPKTSFKIISTGIYRVDIPSGGDARLEVWKGLAEVGNTGQQVKGGRAATMTSNNSATIAKFDRDEKDALDTWSKTRGKELTRMMVSLRRVDLGPRLMGTWGTEWNIFGSFGLWIFNPYYGGYGFLPFGHAWSSPYGYGYYNCIHNYNVSPVIFSPPTVLPTAGGGGPTQTPTPNSTPTPLITAGDRTNVPPFVRMQESMGNGRGMMDHGGSTYDASNNSPSTSSSSSSSSTRDSAPMTKSDPGPAPTRAESPTRKP